METILQCAEKVVIDKPKAPKRRSCLFCGCVRKSNVVWFDDNHCSGKCKKNDGGVIEPVVPQGDENLESYQKMKEIGKLGSMLISKRAEVRELGVQLERLNDEQGDLMAAGLGTKENRLEYAALDAERKALEADIELIEINTIPRKEKEADALKSAENSGKKAELMQEKDNIMDGDAGAFYTINCNAAYWDNLVKESKVPLNRKEKDLYREVVIYDLVRKGLHPRIAGHRIAKLSVYPPDEED